ncbi:hypothetical protein QIS74_06452 [Colletotrichum tabaci]|uniref:SnoaL-like domain-containing protein n=1 Tax=Colletotrichum tabaci TaxID=1209068 RepID=A0AAV9TCX5_9PEZI
MHFFTLLTFGLGTLALDVSAASSLRAQTQPNCPPQHGKSKQQQVIFEDFVQTFYKELNAEKALLNHMPEDYIQHNPNVLSGRQNAIDFAGPLFASGVNFTILRYAVENDFAFIHTRMDINGAAEPIAVVDIWRFEGTCMVEHWDVFQTKDANSTNPLALF